MPSVAKRSCLIYFCQHKYITTIIFYPQIANKLFAIRVFIAFRNNASYSRWWEARVLWGGILNSSRIFARQIINNADDAFQAKKIDYETAESFKKELVFRQIAYAHALNMHLRKAMKWDMMNEFLSQEEWEQIRNSHNIPNLLIFKQGNRIKDGIRSGILGSFDSIGLEPVLSSFQNNQGGCERIKNTPLMRQYHYFTRLFLYVFIITVPFSLIGDFSKMHMDVLTIPVSMVIVFVFAVIGKVGEVNEDPFENRITDVPMSAIANTIERDLKTMLGMKEIPSPHTPKEGYLY